MKSLAATRWAPGRRITRDYLAREEMRPRALEGAAAGCGSLANKRSP